MGLWWRHVAVFGARSISKEELALALPKMGMFVTEQELDDMIRYASVCRHTHVCTKVCRHVCEHVCVDMCVDMWDSMLSGRPTPTATATLTLKNLSE